MLDISLQNFESDLITASTQQPVLLDIWAPWCGPCKALGPVLEKLEAAYAGRFKLAKLNSDDQPEIAGQLSQMFGVRSIPFCVLFKGGQPVDGFVGALPESEVRVFLDKYVPSAMEAAAEEEVDEAGALLADGDIDSAIEKMREAVAINPANDGARGDYLHALLGAGRIAEARRAYGPVATRVLPNARLDACGHWLDACEVAVRARPPEELRQAIAADKRDFAARFELAQIHLASQQFTLAMDELLEIVMRDKTWNGELARKTYVAALELLRKPAVVATAKEVAATESALEVVNLSIDVLADPVVDSYQRRLSMVLF
jgi:putative thioredoxin